MDDNDPSPELPPPVSRVWTRSLRQATPSCTAPMTQTAGFCVFTDYRHAGCTLSHHSSAWAPGIVVPTIYRVVIAATKLPTLRPTFICFSPESIIASVRCALSLHPISTHGTKGSSRGVRDVQSVSRKYRDSPFAPSVERLNNSSSIHTTMPTLHGRTYEYEAAVHGAGAELQRDDVRGEGKRITVRRNWAASEDAV